MVVKVGTYTVVHLALAVRLNSAFYFICDFCRGVIFGFGE